MFTTSIKKLSSFLNFSILLDSIDIKPKLESLFSPVEFLAPIFIHWKHVAVCRYSITYQNKVHDGRCLLKSSDLINRVARRLIQDLINHARYHCKIVRKCITVGDQWSVKDEITGMQTGGQPTPIISQLLHWRKGSF